MRARVKRVLSGVLLAVGVLIVGSGAYMLFLAHQIATLEGRIVVPLPVEAGETAVAGGATPTPLAPYTPTPVRVQSTVAAIIAAATAPPSPPVAPTDPPPAALPPTALPLPTATPAAAPTTAPPAPVVPPTATPLPPMPAPTPTDAPLPTPSATAMRTAGPTFAPTSAPTIVPGMRATLVPLSPPAPPPPLPPSPAPPPPPVATPTIIVILLPTTTPPPPATNTPVFVPLTATPPRPAPAIPAPPAPAPPPTPRPPFPVSPPAPHPPPPAAPTVLPLVISTAPSVGGVLRDGAGLLSGESNGREAVWGGKQVVRILLLGIDRRDDEPSRSDTMILATVDLWNGTVNLLSIPRDLMVSIPGYGEERVNAAFAFGQAARPHDPAAGPALAVKTVSRQFGVTVDHYLFVDFRAFREIVDAVGGVDIIVARPLDDDAYPTEDYRTTHLHFDAGRQHMDGTRALSYARTRHGDDDNLRRERQMQVMQAVLSRAVEGDGVRRMPEVVRTLGANMQTSLPYEAQISLAKLARKMQANGVAQYSITPPLVTDVRGTRWGEVYMGDWAAIRAFVAEATDPRRRQKV